MRQTALTTGLTGLGRVRLDTGTMIGNGTKLYTLDLGTTFAPRTSACV